ncbi:copia protein [Tanacetum coccineum]
MQKELLQFKLQQVWTLVDLPNRKRAIGTKWVYRNKKDERGIVIKNKERLVAQGYTQEEGIDYDEVFALVTRIEVIRLFLAYASFKDFVVYQMDVKSAFIYERELVRIKIDDGNAFWNKIGVNAGDSKLMLLGIYLLLPVLVNACLGDKLTTAVKFNTARHNLRLADQSGLPSKLKTVIEKCKISIPLDKRRVLDLENTNTSQAVEITKLKERFKKLEMRNKSRTPGLKRLRKVGKTAKIESSEDEDEEVTLIDETQGRNDDNLMFDIRVLDEQEVEVEKIDSTAEVTTASATTTTVDELNLAQTLIEIKVAKPKAVTTAATTTTTAVTRPKARGRSSRAK